MKIVTVGKAGTVESSDIIVEISPSEKKGIELHLESQVMQQYGNQIKRVILATLEELGIENAVVTAADKGALDCTVVARTKAAAYRAAESKDYTWACKECGGNK